jgi:hypothetical protein
LKRLLLFLAPAVLLLTASHQAWGAIAFVAETTVASNNTAVTSLAINVPTNANSDLLLLFVGENAGTNSTVNTPAGWTPMTGSPWDNGGAAGLAIFYRIASSEPASYTITLTAAAKVTAAMLSYSGVSASAPFDGNAAESNTSANNTATPTTPSISVTASDVAVSVISTINTDAMSTVSPGTIRADANGNTPAAVAVADAAITITGTQGFSWTMINNEGTASGSQGTTLAIAAAPAPTPTPTSTPTPTPSAPLPAACLLPAANSAQTAVSSAALEKSHVLAAGGAMGFMSSTIRRKRSTCRFSTRRLFPPTGPYRFIHSRFRPAEISTAFTTSVTQRESWRPVPRARHR